MAAPPPRRLLDSQYAVRRHEVAEDGLWGAPDPHTAEGAREYLEVFYRDNSESESSQHNALVHHHRRRRPPVRGPTMLQNCCSAVQKTPAPDIAHARRVAKAEEIDVRLRHDVPAGHGLRLDERLSVVGFCGGISSPALASGVPLHAVLVKVNRQPVRSQADVDRELARWPSGTSVFTFRQAPDVVPRDTVLVSKPGATLYRVLRDCTVRSGKDSQNPKVGVYKRGELIEAVQEDVNAEGLAVLRTRTHCILNKDERRRAEAQPRGGWVKLRSSKGRKNLEKVRQVTESHEGGLGSLSHRWAGLSPMDRAAETVARYERREGADWATKLWEGFYARGEDPLMHWDRREAAVYIQAHVRGHRSRKSWAEHGHSRPLGHAGRGKDQSLRLEPDSTAGMATYRPRFQSRPPASRLAKRPIEEQHVPASQYTGEKLFRAVMRDDVDAVARMLDMKVDVIGPNALHDDQGRTAVQLAKINGPRSKVLRLLEDEEAMLATSRSRSHSHSHSHRLRQQRSTITRGRSVDSEPDLELRPHREFREHDRSAATHRSRDRSRSPSPRRSRSPSPGPAPVRPWKPPPGFDIDDSSSSEDIPAIHDGGRRLRRRQQQLQRDLGAPMTPGERVAAQREVARSRSSPDAGSAANDSKSRHGIRRAARSPGQHHYRRQAGSRSPSPQTQSPRGSTIILRRTSPSTAQDRQRHAEAEQTDRQRDRETERQSVPIWRSPSPKRTIAHRGGGAPDLDADDQTSVLLRQADVSNQTRPGRGLSQIFNRSRSRSRSRGKSRSQSPSRSPRLSIDEHDQERLGRSPTRSRSRSRSPSPRWPQSAPDQRFRLIDGAAIAQLASYRKPPQTVLDTLRAALIALGHPLTFEVQSWSECRRKLTDNEGFADTLNAADNWDVGDLDGLSTWSQRRIDVVRALLAASEDLDRGGAPRGTCHVTSALWDWTDRQLQHQQAQPRADFKRRSGSTTAMSSGRRSRSPSLSPRDATLRVPDVIDDERNSPRSQYQRHRTNDSASIRDMFSSGRQESLSSSNRREHDIMKHGGELRVRVQQLSLLPGGLQNDARSRHPFVALSLARGGDQAEQTTKTVHRQEEATFDQEFKFKLPPARVTRARHHGKYDLRAGDGLLTVSVKDARGYTPLRKPTLIGSDDIDLYALFGPLGRWTAFRSPDGRMTGRRLHYTCTLRQPPPPPDEQSQSSDGGFGNSISNLAGKIRALSPNPRPRPFADAQLEHDPDDERDIAEVRLRLEFTPGAEEQDDHEWEGRAYADSDGGVV